jgi:hypothetical protein
LVIDYSPIECVEGVRTVDLAHNPVRVRFESETNSVDDVFATTRNCHAKLYWSKEVEEAFSVAVADGTTALAEESVADGYRAYPSVRFAQRIESSPAQIGLEVGGQSAVDDRRAGAEEPVQ